VKAIVPTLYKINFAQAAQEEFAHNCEVWHPVVNKATLPGIKC